MDNVLRSNAPPRICNDFGETFEYNDYAAQLAGCRDVKDRRSFYQNDSQQFDQGLQFPVSPTIDIKDPGQIDSKAEVEQGPWPTAHYPTVEVRELYPPHTTYKWPIPHALFCKRLKNFQHEPCEWKAPKYKSYREKQKNNGQKDKHNPWTEDTEIAFQKALRLCGGRGRHKQPLAGKPSGCNEWMSWVIWAETGKCLGRKKVSSHLQVLKGKMDCVPEWLDIARPALEQNKRAKSRHSRHIAHRRQEQLSANRSLDILSAASMQLSSNATNQAKIHSITYEMKLKDNVMDALGRLPEHARTHHVYTELQSERPSDSHTFDDVDKWHSMFPNLETFDSNGTTVPTYLFEAGISLQDDYIQNTVVQVRLDIKVLNGQNYDCWVTKTQLYDEEGCHKSSMDEVEAVTKNCFVILRNVAGSAQYWAKTLKNLLGVEKAARYYGDHEQILLSEHRARECLDHIHFCKQLWAVPQGSKEHKLVANLLWKFYLVGNKIVPTTSWRELVPPRRHSSLSDPTVDLDSNAWPSPVGRDDITFDHNGGLSLPGQIATGGATEMFLDDVNRLPHVEQQLLSAEHSPATEQTAEMGSSILSSASLSFPPSLSGASSMTQQSQQSSFDSLEMNEHARNFPTFSALGPELDDGIEQNHFELRKSLAGQPSSQAYDLTDSLPLSQDQLHDVLSQLPTFLPYDSDYNNLTESAMSSDLVGTNIHVPDGFRDQTYRLSNCNAPDPIMTYSREHEPSSVLGHSPLVAPKAQAGALSQNHILQLQNLDFLQCQGLEEHNSVSAPDQTTHSYAEEAPSTGEEELTLRKLPSQADLRVHGAILPSQPLAKEGAARLTDRYQGQGGDYRNFERNQNRSNADHAFDYSAGTGRTELRLPTNGRLSAYVSPFGVPPPSGNGDREIRDWQHIEENEA